MTMFWNNIQTECVPTHKMGHNLTVICAINNQLKIRTSWRKDMTRHGAKKTKPNAAPKTLSALPALHRRVVNKHIIETEAPSYVVDIEMAQPKSLEESRAIPTTPFAGVDGDDIVMKELAEALANFSIHDDTDDKMVDCTIISTTNLNTEPMDGVIASPPLSPKPQSEEPKTTNYTIDDLSALLKKLTISATHFVVKTIVKTSEKPKISNSTIDDLTALLKTLTLSAPNFVNTIAKSPLVSLEVFRTRAKPRSSGIQARRRWFSLWDSTLRLSTISRIAARARLCPWAMTGGSCRPKSQRKKNEPCEAHWDRAHRMRPGDFRLAKLPTTTYEGTSAN